MREVAKARKIATNGRLTKTRLTEIGQLRKITLTSDASSIEIDYWVCEAFAARSPCKAFRSTNLDEPANFLCLGMGHLDIS